VPHDDFRPGVRLGIDVGKARIGVARCDPHGMLATPLETVARRSDGSDVARIVELAVEAGAIEILVGLPLALSGRATASTDDAAGFAARLASAAGVGVRLVDERLSTVSAHSALRASGRSQKSSRTIVDQVAAVVILQQALDSERSTGRLPGAPVDAEETPTPHEPTPHE
jgi:putative Holliday junction resolvase